MRHTAELLLPYAVNGTVYYNDIRNPALRRLVRMPNVLPAIRRSLQEVDPHLDILVPYRVDNAEAQLVRKVQYHAGYKPETGPVRINLSLLRRNHIKLYKRLYEFGKPAAVLSRRGLVVTYDGKMSLEEAVSEARSAAVGGILGERSLNRRLYKSLHYQARAAGKSLPDFLYTYGLSYLPTKKGDGTC